MKKNRVLIACGIFRDELEHVLGSIDGYDLRVIWLGSGLDNNLELLEAFDLIQVPLDFETCDLDHFRENFLAFLA